MKKKELHGLRLKSISELEKLADEKKKELLKVKIDVYAAKEKDLKKARNLKVDIAQILTIINEMRLSEKKVIDKGLKEGGNN